MNKETKIQIIIISILSIILIVLVTMIPKMTPKKEFYPFNEDKEKDTLGEEVNNGTNINSKKINLNDYNENITITKGGEYTLQGNFNHSVLIDSKEKVTLYLNGVNINSSITSAIANRGTSELVINIKEGTTNILKDDGSSEYDGCIFSNQTLTIEGTGILKVYGKQKDGEGIATKDADITINGGEIYIESNDDGINIGGDNGGIIKVNGGNIVVKANGDGIDSNGSLIINGGKVYTVGSSKGGDSGIDTDKDFEINEGTLIALGSDMLQLPDKSSKQKYISFKLQNKLNKDDKITIKKGKETIIEFEANDDFRTIIISDSKIIKGTYDLYVNNEKTNYSYEVK